MLEDTASLLAIMKKLQYLKILYSFVQVYPQKMIEEIIKETCLWQLPISTIPWGVLIIDFLSYLTGYPISLQQQVKLITSKMAFPIGVRLLSFSAMLWSWGTESTMLVGHMKPDRTLFRRAAYPGLVLLFLLMQFSLIHAGSIQVEPQGLRYPRKEGGKKCGHDCMTRGQRQQNQFYASSDG